MSAELITSSTGQRLRASVPTARSADSEENLWGYAKRLRFVQESILDAFPGRAPSTVRILDIGCGNGSQLAIPLAARGFGVTGVDPDPASIQRAIEMTKDQPNAEFLCMLLDGLAARFDVVILSEVLEHVHEPAQMLRQAEAYLAENGIVIVTVPNGYGAFEIDWWIFRTLRFDRLVETVKGLRQKARHKFDSKAEIAATENHACGHVQFFTYRRLQKMFDDCKLQVFRAGRGSFLCGPMVCYTLAHSQQFVEWNSQITDRMPIRLASGWYFALRRSA